MKKREQTPRRVEDPNLGVPPLDTQKTNNTGDLPPPSLSGAQTTKPEHPKRRLQTNGKGKGEASQYQWGQGQRRHKNEKER